MTRSINKHLNVVPTTSYSFTYSMEGVLEDLPAPWDFCISCVYDLEIVILDPDGVEEHREEHTFSELSPDCSSSTFSRTKTFNVTFTDIGTYTIIKTLRLNKLSFEEALEDLATTSASYPDLEDFEEEYLSGIDTTECDYTCEQHCISILKADGIPSPTPAQIAECMEEYCDSLIDEAFTEASGSECQSMLGLMRADVDLGGWLNDDDAFINAHKATALAGTGYETASPATIRANWKGEWVDKFVIHHREYCHYTSCKSDSTSRLYDYRMTRKENYTDASAAGYIDPLGMGSSIPTGYNPGVSTVDPFYTGLSSADKTKLEDAMLDYYDDGGTWISLWEFVDPASSPVASALYYHSTTAAEKDITRYRLFRGAYQDLKLKLQEDIKAAEPCAYTDDEHTIVRKSTIDPGSTHDDHLKYAGDLLDKHASGTCEYAAEGWMNRLYDSCDSATIAGIIG